MADSNLKIVALIGSIREKSLNRALFEAARELAPHGVSLIEAPLAELPLFNDDRDGDHPPETVATFRETVKSADGLLFITPEYNYSVPGVLKNAIDWGSRPSGRGAINGKPGAIMGVAVGRSGTMRAQLHLRDILLSLGVLTMSKPEIYVTFAGDKFDTERTLIDQETRSHVAAHIAAFQAWIERLG